MSHSFTGILRCLVDNGFAQEALGAASACRAAYWDELLWDRLVHVRSCKQYSFASAPRSRTRVMEAASRGRMDRLSWLLERRGVSVTSRGAGGSGGGLLVSAIDFFGRSALHYALWSGSEEAVVSLVASGAYLFGRDHEYNVPVQLIYSRVCGMDVTARVTDEVVRGRIAAGSGTAQLMLKHAFVFGCEGCVASLLGAGVQVEGKSYPSDEAMLWHSGLRNRAPFPTLLAFMRIDGSDSGSVSDVGDSNDGFAAAAAATPARAARAHHMGEVPRPGSYASMIRSILGSTKKRDAKVSFASFALRVACLAGDVEGVSALLGTGLLGSLFSNDKYSTIFSYAVSGSDRSRHGAITRLLVDGGAPTFVNDPKEIQPLWFALSMCSPESARALVDAGAASKIRALVESPPPGLGFMGRLFIFPFPLQYIDETLATASEDLMLETIRVYLDAKISTDSQLSDMTSTLDKMCEYGLVKCVRLILESGVLDLSSFDLNRPLMLALHSKHDNPEMIDLIISLMPQAANEKLSEKLILPVKKSNAKVVRYLLTSGYLQCTFELISAIFLLSLELFPTSSDSEAAMDILSQLFTEMKKFKRKIADAYISSALHMACVGGLVESVSELLELTPDLSSENHLQLLSAALLCDNSSKAYSTTKLLLSKGNVMNFEREKRGVLLTIACTKYHVDCIKVLLHEIQDQSMVLYFSILFNILLEKCPDDPFEIFDILLERVVDYEISVGPDAFLSACFYGRYRCLEALLRCWRPTIKDDAKFKDKPCSSPLVLSCSKHNKDGAVLRLLLDNGYGENQEHVRDALRNACQNLNVDAVRMLLERGMFDSDSLYYVDSLISSVPHEVASDAEQCASAEIMDMLAARGLKPRSISRSMWKWVLSEQTPNVEYLNALLSHFKSFIKFNDLHQGVTFNHYFDKDIPHDKIIRTADMLSTIRAAGGATDALFKMFCGMHSSRLGRIAGLLASILSGESVNVRRDNKDAIYVLIKNYYDPLPVSLMLQAGARFDEEALVKCVPKQSKAELRDLIATYSNISIPDQRF